MKREINEYILRLHAFTYDLLYTILRYNKMFNLILIIIFNFNFNGVGVVDTEQLNYVNYIIFYTMMLWVYGPIT